jgi:hypothetical protein
MSPGIEIVIFLMLLGGGGGVTIGISWVFLTWVGIRVAKMKERAGVRRGW